MHLARVVLTAVVLVASPALFAAPCAGFNDVSDSDPFCVYVEWMKNRSITLGTSATTYAPDSPVTRLQMAAFMYRLGFHNAFLQGGSAFGAAAVIGTTDNQPLEVRVNGQRVMRFEPSAISPSVIGGSPTNSIAAGVRGATIAGGGVPAGDTDPNLTDESPNHVSDHYGTVGGGYANTADLIATVSGGRENNASQSGATIGGGIANTASGSSSTVSGGHFNAATSTSATISGGDGNTATGAYATVAGGQGNDASGTWSFAAGRSAEASSAGCFVFSDASAQQPTQCGVANAFVVRAKGGFYMLTGGTFQTGYTGAYLPPNTTAWSTVSDRAAKEDIAAVEPRDVLERLASIPIATWRWKGEDAAIRHMGPVAQDFHAAFRLGESDLRISTVDADGVALAAIQGLNAKVDSARAAKDAEIAELRAELAELRGLRAEVAALRAAFAAQAGSPAILANTSP